MFDIFANRGYLAVAAALISAPIIIHLINSMRFRETHTEAAGPLRVRELVNYSPIAEGIRYVRSDLRLLATMLAKCGIGILGASWVIFPVMGERVFPLTGHGLTAARASMFSMSLLMAARGVGSVIGPLLAASWAGQNQHRLRSLILFGLTAGGIGYILLGRAPNLALACAAIVFAHMGASNIWVSSTTLLQLNTDDRFRGRVFSADLGFAMLMMAISCFVSGRIVDSGVSARTLASGIGLVMMVPAAGWLWAQGLWRQRAGAQAPQGSSSVGNP